MCDLIMCVRGSSVRGGMNEVYTATERRTSVKLMNDGILNGAGKQFMRI